MDILVNTMLGTSHSWAVTMRFIALEFLKLHNLKILSTNGYNLVPELLTKKMYGFDRDNDLEITYTIPINYKNRFCLRSKLKYGLYNWESSIMPKEWVSYQKYIDKIIVSSNYSKNIFLNNGWSSEKVCVVPLGVSKNTGVDIYSGLKTRKNFKFLNVSIPHGRKNLDLLIRAYYNSFSYYDDVCLVIKTNRVSNNNYFFEVDILNIISNIKKEYSKKLPEVEFVFGTMSSLDPLYRACHCLVNVSSFEGFGLTMLEAMNNGCLVISSCSTGESEFISEKNSIILKSEMVLAPKTHQYWEYNSKSKCHMPAIEDVSNKMSWVCSNYNKIKNKKIAEMIKTSSRYTWENTAKKIIEL